MSLSREMGEQKWAKAGLTVDGRWAEWVVSGFNLESVCC